MSRTHENIQDELLVLRCQAGDGAALKALIARWQPKLAGLAWRLTTHRDAAQDITQDSWLAIVRGLKRLDDPAAFRSWAFRIVRNKCADWTRRCSVEREACKAMQDSAALDSTDGTIGSGAESGVRLLRQSMAKLPPDQRTMLSLHYIEGMGVAEIAAVLGTPTGTVKSRLYYARERLREILERAKT